MTGYHCISSEMYPGNGEPVMIKIDLLDHIEGVSHLCKGFDIVAEDWPDGYGISNEIVTLSTHQGTHIDAPLHYHPAGHPISDADVNNFIGKAVIICDSGTEPYHLQISPDIYLDRLDAYKNEATAVFFITGAYKTYGMETYFHNFKGVPVELIEAALDRGYNVIGTDAFSLDPPFAVMSREFVHSRNQSVLWPAHVLGRKRPYYQIERLCNLHPFETAELVDFIALPIKIRSGASWTRAVARIRK